MSDQAKSSDGVVFLRQTLKTLVSHNSFVDSAFLEMKPYALQRHGRAKAAPTAHHTKVLGSL